MLDTPGLRSRNPITLPGYRRGMANPNKGRRFPAEVLTRAEVMRLMAACPRKTIGGQRTRALIALLYGTGLRISEALDLEVKDIDLETGQVAVLHGKGDRRRVVGIDANSQAVVEAWLERRRELGLRGGIVFCVFKEPRLGGRMYSSSVRETFALLAERAGLEKRVHPHGLRHTHAVEIAREGVGLHLIRRQLGHTNLGTTARYIDHLSPLDVVDAIRARKPWASQHEQPPPGRSPSSGADGPPRG